MRNPFLDDEDIRDLPDFLRHLEADIRQAQSPSFSRTAPRPAVEPLPPEAPPAAPVDARPVAQVRIVPTAPPRPAARRPARMPSADPRRSSSQGSLL